MADEVQPPKTEKKEEAESLDDKSLDPCDNNNESKLVPMSPTFDNDGFIQASDNRLTSLRPGSWHDHVYATPPRTPTPHRISDILGWGLTKPSLFASTKLLAPTPRRFTSSPLIRAPMPLYPSAQSPVSMQGSLTSPPCTPSPASPLTSPSSCPSDSRFPVRPLNSTFHLGVGRSASADSSVQRDEAEDRPLNLSTGSRARSPADSAINGRTIFAQTSPTMFREPQSEPYLLGVHQRNSHHQPYSHNGSQPVDSRAHASVGKCVPRPNTKGETGRF